MKCLLCSASFNNDEKLIEHYIEYHKINQGKKFFQKHFQPSKKVPFFASVFGVVIFDQLKVSRLSMIF